MIKYLEALGKMADGKATKIFMPMEASGILSGVGAIGEMLRGEQPMKEIEGRTSPAKAGEREEEPKKAEENGHKTIYDQLVGHKEKAAKKDKDEEEKT